MAFYLIFGSDTIKSRERFNQLVARFLKEGSFSLFKIDEESFSEAFLNDVLKTGSIFLEKKLVAANRLFANSLARDYILRNLEKIGGSDNVFVCLEEEMKKEDLDVLKKKADKVEKFELPAGKKSYQGGGLFHIADLFALRKKEDLWLAYQREVFNGTPTEEIFWKIVWQIKNLLAVKKGGGAGLHPFVRQKTKKAVAFFKEEELRGFSSELLELYHKSRAGAADMAVGLEKFLLRV